MKLVKRPAIYLDVCALSRPYDEQEEMGIRRETAAVDLIMSKIIDGKYTMCFSPVHLKEIQEIEDGVEREELLSKLVMYGRDTGTISELESRADELTTKGFGAADAAHVAYAEAFNASFITCDYPLLRKCKRNSIKVWSGKPDVFCQEENLQ